MLPRLGARAYFFLNVAAGKEDNQFPYQLEAVGVMDRAFFLHPHHETVDEGGVISYVPLMFSGLVYPQLCLKCQLYCAASVKCRTMSLESFRGEGLDQFSLLLPASEEWGQLGTALSSAFGGIRRYGHQNHG